jgi:hypothetical protein
MKRLMDVADQVSNEPKRSSVFVARCIWSREHLHIPRNRLNDAVTQLAITLLVVGVRVRLAG